MDAIIKLQMKFVLCYLSSRPDSESLYLKPPLELAHHLLRSENHITMSTFIVAFTEPGDIANMFCTPFVRCTTSELVHLNGLSTEAAYHRQLATDYVNDIMVFTRKMYELVVRDPRTQPARSTWQGSRRDRRDI